MKKKYYISILFLFCYPLFAFCQVGINTVSPLGVFHIDAKSNNTSSGSNKYEDDILVTPDGDLGIGLIAPTGKVHIKTTGTVPGFRLENGSQQQGKILISDESGYGTWGSLTIGSGSILWRVKNPAFYFSGTSQKFYASSLNEVDFSSNIKGVVSYDTQYLSIPPGKYLFFWRGDLVGIEEYMKVDITAYYASAPAMPIKVVSPLYEHYLSSVAYYNILEFAKLEINVQMLNANNNVGPGYTLPIDGYFNPPLTNSAWYELVLLKLDID
ncbi:hypothetical protein CLV62_11246 [Dysgonomonas alginatilytica]|uniref:Uncharacterized protein n=1 Tax=Dysgonomonas alginatilytica TaxID=1605892 RepID=A0A2V3PQ00_9BACT|nr:hypothetical protein [Dysgonomonas alginatilytica]PXV63797.1 hypothetical protein CLV62_11246 [Dysgonomonas alginatilytica]